MGGGIGGLMADDLKRRKGSYDIHSLPCPLSDGIWQRQDPLLGYALYFCCHARTALACMGVFGRDDDGEGDS